MFCRKCGTELPGNAVACWKCGHLIHDQPLPQTQIVTPNQRGLSDFQVGCLAVFLLAVFVGLILVAVSYVRSLNSKEATTPTVQTPLRPPDYQPRVQEPVQPPPPVVPIPEPPYVVMDGVATIAPGQFNYRTFKINIQRRLKGNFKGQGGSRNDVQVMVLSENDFINYRNGNSYRTYYDSGRATVGEINIILGPGRYYVVISNSWSIFSNKVAQVQLHLESP